jgi:AbrB family looped-hinge helix DNA binding protein
VQKQPGRRALPKRAENAAFSRVSVKSQTVIPREVRERLGIKPGDRLRYRMTEWATSEDAAAYDDL